VAPSPRATNTVIKKLAITGGSGLAVDSITHAVYITGNETLTVIDGKTQTVMATVSIGQHPAPVVVDEVTHIAYVGDGDDSDQLGTVSAVAWRPDVLEDLLRHP
jgi:YVTN family beta-propeller protein